MNGFPLGSRGSGWRCWGTDGTGEMVGNCDGGLTLIQVNGNGDGKAVRALAGKQ